MTPKTAASPVGSAELGFDRDASADRRHRLLETLCEEHGDGVLVVASGSEVLSHGDVHFSFRPGSDFDYLCGFPEPEAILCVWPETQRGRRKVRSKLFVQPKDRTAEIWHGRRFGPTAAKRQFGVEDAAPLAEFGTWLGTLLEPFDRLFFRVGADPALDERLFRVFKNRATKRRRQAVAAHPALIDPVPALARQRLIKDEHELMMLRAASFVTCAGHAAAIQGGHPGEFEFEIQARLEATFRELGSKRNGYDSIVASGVNACILHYTENRRRTKKGDLVLIDAGAEVGGYTADVTRTWPVSGTFTEPQARVYNAVLKAQRAAIRAVRVGRSYTAIHKIAVRSLTKSLVDLGVLQGKPDKLIAENAFRAYYMHGTGHYLGRDVHDVGPYEDATGRPVPLEAGMVLTVEPGLYFDPKDKSVPAEFRGIGIRIEDDVLVTDDGPEVLTAALPTGLRDLEAMRQAGLER